MTNEEKLRVLDGLIDTFSKKSTKLKAFLDDKSKCEQNKLQTFIIKEAYAETELVLEAFKNYRGLINSMVQCSQKR